MLRGSPTLVGFFVAFALTSASVLLFGLLANQLEKPKEADPSVKDLVNTIAKADDPAIHASLTEKPKTVDSTSPFPQYDAVLFVKKRSSTVTAPQPISQSDVSHSLEEREKRGKQSEVGHSLACVLRAHAENRSVCANTQLESLAAALKADTTTYVFKDRQYDWPERSGRDGIEWILWLLVDAGIPLETLHNYLSDFPSPACIVVPELMPSAIQSIGESRKHSAGQGEESPFTSSARTYETAKSLGPDDASAALAFPRYAVRRDHDLLFSELKELTPDCAAILATHRHSLEFPKLESLSLESAEAIAHHRGGGSRTGALLDDKLVVGISDLTPDIAAALAAKKGRLQVGTQQRPLKDISRETATALSFFNGRVLTLCVGEVSAESQDELAKCVAPITFVIGPTLLSSEKLARKLASYSPITFSCNQLTQDAAATLGEAGQGKDMTFLERFTCDESVARSLATYPGEILFTQLAVSPEVLAALEIVMPPIEGGSTAATSAPAEQSAAENVNVQESSHKVACRGMPGGTEQQLVEAYGPVEHRDERSDRTVLAWRWKEDKQVVVLATMVDHKCDDIALQLVGDDGTPVSLADCSDNGIMNITLLLNNVTGSDGWMGGRFKKEYSDILFGWRNGDLKCGAVVWARQPDTIVIRSYESD